MKNIAILSAFVAALAAPVFAGDRADAIFADLAEASDGETQVISNAGGDLGFVSTKSVTEGRAADVFAALSEASDGETEVRSGHERLVSVLSSKGGQSARVAGIFADLAEAGAEDES